MEENSISRGKQWVVKDNRYIQAKFTNYKPSLIQNRLVLWLAGQVHSKNDSEFNTHYLTANKCRDIMQSSYSISRLKSELIDLRSATAVMETSKGGWKVFGIIDEAEYDSETEKVALKLSEAMKPFLLKIGENKEGGFTRYELETVMKMRSVHSQRIYELLWQYKNLGRGNSRIIKLKDLKEYLGLIMEKKGTITEKYSRWVEFERVVLRQVEQDLCNNGLIMSYIPLKQGKKIYAVRFIFMLHTDDKEQVLETWRKLALVSISPYQKVQLANLYNLEVIEKAIQVCNQKDDCNYERLLEMIPERKIYQSAIFRKWEDSQTNEGKKETAKFLKGVSNSLEIEMKQEELF